MNPFQTTVARGHTANCFLIAGSMLLHQKGRAGLTCLGLGVAFFLVAVQFGLLVGWINTTSALIRYAEVDVWVQAKHAPAFDYATPIPKAKLHQLRSVPGVAWAEGMVMAWNIWQAPDGRRVNVELIGLGRRGVGGPWEMREGAVDAVHYREGAVIVDELYLKLLGVKEIGETFELIAKEARVVGISQGVRTFTTSPFVFTSIDSAIKFDRRYQPDEITFAMGKCAEGHDPESVREAASSAIPDVEVLTTKEMARRTVRYWMLETGAGMTVVITAVLGLLVGAVIMSQTLFAITQDHLKDYATLIALGFGRDALVKVVLAQAAFFAVSGMILGSAVFFFSASATARTPIPLEMNAPVFAGIVAVSLIACIGASILSIKALFRVDPVTVFHS